MILPGCLLLFIAVSIHTSIAAYNPTPQDLSVLREWIKQMPYIPQDYDDQFLSAFFRSTKGRMQKTKMALEFSSSLGGRFPELFRDLDPTRKTMQDCLKRIYFYEIPEETFKDETIIGVGFQPGNNYTKNYNIFELFRIFMMHLLICIKEKPNWSTKIIAIFDGKHATIDMLKDITPTTISLAIDCIKKGSGGRIQAVHWVNVPAVVEWIFIMLKTLAPKKIKKRFFVHNKGETLQQYISKDLLPKEYDGTCGTIEKLSTQWIAKMMKNRDYLIYEDERNRKLDHLRPKYVDDDLTETFRKLNVD